jgi:hypothetical protein
VDRRWHMETKSTKQKSYMRWKKEKQAAVAEDQVLKENLARSMSVLIFSWEKFEHFKY